MWINKPPDEPIVISEEQLWGTPFEDATVSIDGPLACNGCGGDICPGSKVFYRKVAEKRYDKRCEGCYARNTVPN